ncbi:MAG: hypothetical protein NZ742_01055 [Acidobacteria bacterium]|nr:hypothetical protein [Acidobacteriota bacterium]MDW7983425.1 hypothetical protein [Acidobacteriota bacterium]
MTAIGMLGCGNVGTGFLEILKRRRWHEGRFQVRRALVTDPHRERLLPIPVELTDRPEAIVGDPSIQVVVDVLPDSATAYNPVVQALENRKTVITANRALVAEYGLELEQRAFRQNVPFLYRAALMAGVPAAAAFREYMLVSPVRAICGVLQRVGHVTLTAMTQGRSPEEALQKCPKWAMCPLGRLQKRTNGKTCGAWPSSSGCSLGLFLDWTVSGVGDSGGSSRLTWQPPNGWAS